MTAIYARQSVEKRDSLSIGDQIDRCREKLPEDERFEVYKDEGYSGKDTERPAFKRMMTDVEARRIEKIVFYKLDRVSRNLTDFAKMAEKLEKYGVALFSCTDNIDTSTPSGRAMLSVTMVFAQMEREQIQQRVTDNYYSRGRRGFYLGGCAPFGYAKTETRKDGKKTYTFKPFEPQAEIVQSLFRDYADTGVSLGGLARRLTADNVSTNSGKPWSSAPLGRLLRNPVYVRADADVYAYLKAKGAEMNNAVSDYTGENGCYLYGPRKDVTTSKFTNLSKSYVTLGLHGGLTDADTWLRCQRKLDANRQVKNSGKGGYSWLSGLAKCGYCGYAVYGAAYITCGGRKLRVCNGRKKVTRLGELELAVEARLLEYIDGLEVCAEPPPVSPRLKIERVRTEEQIAAFIARIPEADAAVMARINAEVGRLEARLEALKPSAEVAQVKREDIDWANADAGRRKAIAARFIERVTVADENIGVFFRVPPR
ncbi:serine recombinase [Clostridia bacterium]|nr:serine recombinase [Clostridia bacterium]